MFYKILFFFAFLFMLQNVCAEPPFYFLCGPDEDGCPEGSEQYCACIPANIKWQRQYCLDFDQMKCIPFIKAHPNCSEKLRFDTQAECLATIFQSEPNPVCGQQTLAFCKAHLTYICDENGNPNSCKKISG